MFKNESQVIHLLIEAGVISEDQREKAEEFSKIVRKPLLDALCEMGFVQRAQVINFVAQHFHFEKVELAEASPPCDAVHLLDPVYAKRYHAIPLEDDGREVKVAMADPFDLDAVDNLHYLLRKDILTLIADPQEIEAALTKYYGATEEVVDQVIQGFADTDVTVLSKEAAEEIAEEDPDVPIVKLVNLLMVEAFRNRSSDIHLEPLERKFRVRYRIDGVLQEVQSPPKRLQPSVISRLKIMANMSIAERRLPQDGRIKANLLGKEIDLRVSSIPTSHGESIVMRLLDKSNVLMGLGQLGFLSEEQKRYEQLISQPNGILLITGPTGSGKTTTLYACLNFINRPDRKLITVEDPVEYQLPGINQVQVSEAIGLSFANVLRSILRQAPNVIMIGEIRDHETAEIAIHAALTGHLVFSTLHTNDAPGAITRLIDQGVKPFLVASSLIGVLAQRLVRTICPQCKAPYTPLEPHLKLMKVPSDQLKDMVFYKGKGCENCHGTGYRGRIGIMELLTIDESIRQLIYQKASSTLIRKRGRELGMKTLREDGIQKVLGAVTTLEEVFRITVGDED
ncbi:MAG: Flp pilus assembly complex ATPase component TadA [Chlamydiae bacterium]|nr:Flp pilus assembly complex ATPase component TadA [Chlamydiota bacterium]MBI3266231.1 Flp pilus assembly complex ATPase component TadA [Chlamydiota bacterium]